MIVVASLKLHCFGSDITSRVFSLYFGLNNIAINQYFLYSIFFYLNNIADYLFIVVVKYAMLVSFVRVFLLSFNQYCCIPFRLCLYVFK